MTDMPDTPLPAGCLATLDRERAVELMNLLVDGDVAGELIRVALTKGSQLAHHASELGRGAPSVVVGDAGVSVESPVRR